jgi:hypothetical protein
MIEADRKLKSLSSSYFTIRLENFCEEKLRAVSPLGGVGFRPVKVANPEGGGGV